MAHTPGPWIADDFEVRNESGELVAEVNYIQDGYLIAAAPELLEACKAALGEQYERTALDEDLVSMLEAAIAKAEGRNATHE